MIDIWWCELRDYSLPNWKNPLISDPSIQVMKVFFWIHPPPSKSVRFHRLWAVVNSWSNIPKNPDPSRKFVGLMVETSHPQNRIIGEIPFLGHIWILRVPNLDDFGVLSILFLILMLKYIILSMSLLVRSLFILTQAFGDYIELYNTSIFQRNLFKP